MTHHKKDKDADRAAREAEARAAAMLRIAKETAPILKDVDLDHGRLLYDEQGLPR